MATLGMQTVAETGPDGQPRIVQKYTIDGVPATPTQIRQAQQAAWDANMAAQAEANVQMDESKAAAEALFVPFVHEQEG